MGARISRLHKSLMEIINNNLNLVGSAFEEEGHIKIEDHFVATPTHLEGDGLNDRTLDPLDYPYENLLLNFKADDSKELEKNNPLNTYVLVINKSLGECLREAELENLIIKAEEQVKGELPETYLINAEWADDYNDWLKIVDPAKIERHHVFSNKNSELKKVALFKEGLLDEEILNDPRNIMILPKESGLHPTMNTHNGRHINDHIEKMKANLDKIYNEYRKNIITKNQIETRYWEEVARERNSLYHGKSALYKKDAGSAK